jgi:hypothetical protein
MPYQLLFSDVSKDTAASIFRLTNKFLKFSKKQAFHNVYTNWHCQVSQNTLIFKIVFAYCKHKLTLAGRNIHFFKLQPGEI